MKKILVLGGAANQVPLIESAKQEGLHVVLCDWTTTNPGIALADRHYQVSTMDREAVLNVASREHVDGVVTNSEPAAANAAYVTETLGLPGNPLTAIELLTSKFAFRELQDRLGLYAPRHFICRSCEELLLHARTMSSSYVVKPVHSSGSRGTTRFDGYDEEGLRQAWADCAGFSRDRCCAIEEYVPKAASEIIDGDVFVLGDEILWDGLFASARSPLYPLVPMTQIYPLRISDSALETVKETLRRLFKGAGIVWGQHNVEAYFTPEGRLFVIEINPRQGGNRIPMRILEQSGVDMNRLLVMTAVGEFTYYNSIVRLRRKNKFLTFHQIFNPVGGVFSGVDIASEIGRYVLRVEYVRKIGERIEACRNATGLLAFVCLEFPDAATQDAFRGRYEELLRPVVK